MRFPGISLENVLFTHVVFSSAAGGSNRSLSTVGDPDPGRLTTQPWGAGLGKAFFVFKFEVVKPSLAGGLKSFF